MKTKIKNMLNKNKEVFQSNPIQVNDLLSKVHKELPLSEVEVLKLKIIVLYETNNKLKKKYKHSLQQINEQNVEIIELTTDTHYLAAELNDLRYRNTLV